MLSDKLKARRAGADRLLDPGANGTVLVTKDDSVLVIESVTGTRSLQAAAQLPIGTRVTVFSFAASATINSTAIADGGYLEFIVGVNASGAHEWEVIDTVAELAAVTALAARVTAIETITVKNEVGTSYTVIATDNGKLVTFNNAAAVTVTVPAGLAVGFNCKVMQLGAGLVTFQGDGTMVVNTESGALTLDAAPGRGDLIVYATNLCNFARYDVAAA